MNCFLKWAKFPFKQREICLSRLDVISSRYSVITQNRSVLARLLECGKPVFVVLGADIINDLNRQAGTAISLKDRKAAPALGSRFLRSYVPLRCVPNESGSARDMAVPAYVGHIFLIYLYDKDRFAGKTLDLF